MSKQVSFVLSTVLMMTMAGCTGDHKAPLEPSILSNAMGRDGEFDASSGSYRFEVSRPTLQVKLNGTRISSASTYARVYVTGSQEKALVVGELPLRQGEIDSAVLKVLDSGFEIDSLHNVSLWDDPRISSLHFEGVGTEEQMARGLGNLFRGSLSFEEHPSLVVPRDAGSVTFDTDRVRKNLWDGKQVDGTYQVSTGRGASLSGFMISEPMGIRSHVEFSGTSAQALVQGDISMLETESSSVLKRLLLNDFRLVSVHTHLSHEMPRLLFARFVGVGPIESLAKKVREVFQEEKNFRGST